MTDTSDVRRIVEKALANAKEAGLDVTKQSEHAMRALLQMHPELTDEKARQAVLRILRPY